MSTSITVVAIVEAKPETQEELEAGIRAVVEPTRAEAGCLSYVATRDLKTAGRYVFVEEWESQAALDAHMRTPHLRTFGGVVKSLGASLQVMTLQPLD